MKSFTEYFTFNTKNKYEIVNITGEAREVVEKSGIREGMLLVSAMHITAGVFINDDEPGFRLDLEEMLQRLAPDGADYHHHRTGEVNGDAHMKNILVGHQVIVPVTAGRMDLGPWQRIFYAEFDGKRNKRLIMKAIGE
ncbi:MAG: secondary thiamine-phosphate synthase enzyme YjbQ [Chloroflexi bacterium]|nr:secondary thiamine-phosphate synthase enzyme YjbQ [Chloroflexota bacterium]